VQISCSRRKIFIEIIAKRMRELREGIGLTQKKIAKLLKITQTSIFRYENLNADPPLETLLWYANYFDVLLDYIFGRPINRKENCLRIVRN
jgi:transcriptional regulator with XRE-family HTH domain